MMRRQIAGGYEQTINEKACDVNEDGRINSADVILVRRYIAGGYGVNLGTTTEKHTHTMKAVEAKSATCTERVISLIITAHLVVSIIAMKKVLIISNWKIL